MLAEPGPETANCDGEILTPVMFRVAVPVFVIFTACAELVAFISTEPNPNDVGVTVAWADPGVELVTVSVKLTDPCIPLLAHARTTIRCVPGAITMLVLILFVAPVWYTEEPST